MRNSSRDTLAELFRDIAHRVSFGGDANKEGADA